MSETKSRKLGRRQKEALALLKEHGTYFKKCGWKYNSHSETVEVLLSLVSKGYVITFANGDNMLTFQFVGEPSEVEEASPAVPEIVPTQFEEGTFTEPASQPDFAQSYM